MLYYPHPLNPPPTAHPFDEYPVRLDIDMMRLREIYMYIYILFLYTILRIYDYIYIYIYIYIRHSEQLNLVFPRRHTICLCFAYIFANQ